MNEAIHYFSALTLERLFLYRQAGRRVVCAPKQRGLLPAYERGLLPACAGGCQGGFGRYLPRQGIHCSPHRTPCLGGLAQRCVTSDALTGSPSPAEGDAPLPSRACCWRDIPRS